MGSDQLVWFLPICRCLLHPVAEPLVRFVGMLGKQAVIIHLCKMVLDELRNDAGLKEPDVTRCHFICGLVKVVQQLHLSDV